MPTRHLAEGRGLGPCERASSCTKLGGFLAYCGGCLGGTDQNDSSRAQRAGRDHNFTREVCRIFSQPEERAYYRWSCPGCDRRGALWLELLQNEQEQQRPDAVGAGLSCVRRHVEAG